MPDLSVFISVRLEAPTVGISVRLPYFGLKLYWVISYFFLALAKREMKVQFWHKGSISLLSSNPSIMAVARGPSRIEFRDCSRQLPRAVTPLWSRQHGTTVPSTRIAKWLLRAWQNPLVFLRCDSPTPGQVNRVSR